MLIFVLSQNLQPFQVATTRGTAAPAAAAAVETTSSNVGGGRALIMEGRKAGATGRYRYAKLGIVDGGYQNK